MGWFAQIMIVDRYLNQTKWLAVQILTMKILSLFDGKLASQVVKRHM